MDKGSSRRRSSSKRKRNATSDDNAPRSADDIDVKCYFEDDKGEKFDPPPELVASVVKMVCRMKQGTGEFREWFESQSYEYLDGTPVTLCLANFPIELAINKDGKILISILHWQPRALSKRTGGVHPAVAVSPTTGKLISDTFRINQKGLSKELFDRVVHFDLICVDLGFAEMRDEELHPESYGKPEAQLPPGKYVEIQNKWEELTIKGWVGNEEEFEHVVVALGSQTVKNKVEKILGREKVAKFLKSGRLISLYDTALAVAVHPEVIHNEDVQVTMGEASFYLSSITFDDFNTLIRQDFFGPYAEPCTAAFQIFSKQFTDEELKYIIEEAKSTLNYLKSNYNSPMKVMETGNEKVKSYLVRVQEPFFEYRPDLSDINEVTVSDLHGE